MSMSQEVVAVVMLVVSEFQSQENERLCNLQLDL